MPAVPVDPGFAAGLLTALILTPLVRILALRAGFIDAPRGDRHHLVPTPYLGGAAVFLALTVALLVTRRIDTSAGLSLAGARPALLLYFVALSSFALGLLDDWRHLSPPAKMAGQVVICSTFMAAAGPGPFGSPVWDGLFGFFWIVGFMNAFNFLDNMDGVLAGVSFLAALTLAVLSTGGGAGAGWLLALAGAVLGFLVFNRPPARIFLGDAGSLCLGATLAAAGWLWASAGGERTHWLALPLVLAFPLFDIIFVTLTRLARRQAPWVGGRDHTTHRLATWLGGRWRALLLVYGLSFAAGLTGVIAAHAPGSGAALLLVGAGAVVFLALGLRLGRVPVR